MIISVWEGKKIQIHVYKEILYTRLECSQQELVGFFERRKDDKKT